MTNKDFKGTTVIRDCSAGLLFNANYNYCDWPANVKCGSTGGSTTTTVSTSAATSPTFPPLTGSTTKPGTNSENDPNFCVDKGTGLFSHPGDCQKYYNCFSGNTAVFTCFPGTLWNNVIKSCDWEANVKCDLDTTEEPVTEDPVTTEPVTAEPVTQGQVQN